MDQKPVRTFCYSDGAVVQVNDVVPTGNQRIGRVVRIIQPLFVGADCFACPEGGVLIEEEWGDQKNLRLETPSDERSFSGFLTSRLGIIRPFGNPTSRGRADAPAA